MIPLRQEKSLIIPEVTKEHLSPTANLVLSKLMVLALISRFLGLFFVRYIVEFQLHIAVFIWVDGGAH